MALGETQIVAETRQFLLENGVALDSFSQVMWHLLRIRTGQDGCRMCAIVACVSLSHVCRCRMCVVVACVSLSHMCVVSHVCRCHMCVVVTCVSLSHVCRCHMCVVVTCVSLSHVCRCHMCVVVTCVSLSEILYTIIASFLSQEYK